MKGRVVVLKQPHAPLEIEEYDLPELEPGAILVKMTLATICGTDLHAWRGDDQGRRVFPSTGMAFGHEGTGVVYSLGKGVATDSAGRPLKEGDRVVYGAKVSCGRCLLCLNGDDHMCPQGMLTYRRAPAGSFPYFIGAFGDFIYLPPNHPIFKAPDELPDEVLAPINCAVGTVYQGLRSAELRFGQRVVIQGAGGLGLSAVGIAKEAGAAQIIAIDGQESRLRLAQEFGATHTVDINEFPTAEERVARVQEITGGAGADLVVEVVGLGSLVAEGVSMLATSGTVLEIGDVVGGEAHFRSMMLHRGRSIIGSGMYRPALLPEIVDFLVRAQRTSPFHKIVSHKFPLAEVNRAFQEAEWSDRTTPVIRSAIFP